jgi:methylenetetrahydrofolate--tRNA-(uracil-5-)-methyltransferase
VVREEATALPDEPTIVASGPLTSPSLSSAIAALSGQEHLYFFDAIAPIVSLESINMEIAFRASRYERGEQAEGDYINCPMNRDEYDAFVTSLLGAERIRLESFEQELEQGVRAGWHQFFEGGLPVEILAGRGRESLAFGPMRPVGLTDPRTGRRPYAVVQLRQDNLAGTLFNMVGFQTNLKFPEQKRVFCTIPGLEKAEFVRYGQMHRNTFINSPTLLRPTLQFKGRDELFLAGQITGTEGYVGSALGGLLAGINMARLLDNEPLIQLPPATMCGALFHYITHAAADDFQPMKANMGLLPPLPDHVRNKRLRYTAYAERAKQELENCLEQMEFSPIS